MNDLVSPFGLSAFAKRSSRHSRRRRRTDVTGPFFINSSLLGPVFNLRFRCLRRRGDEPGSVGDRGRWRSTSTLARLLERRLSSFWTRRWNAPSSARWLKPGPPPTSRRRPNPPHPSTASKWARLVRAKVKSRLFAFRRPPNHESQRPRRNGLLSVMGEKHEWNIFGVLAPQPG